MSTPPPPPPGNQPPPPQYGGAPPGYEPYGAAPANPTNSGMAIAGFVCSLVGLIPCFWLAQLPGILGTIFGFIGLKQTRDGQRKGRGMAIAAVVIGLILVAFAIVLVIVLATSDDCGFEGGVFECNFD